MPAQPRDSPVVYFPSQKGALWFYLEVILFILLFLRSFVLIVDHYFR